MSKKVAPKDPLADIYLQPFVVQKGPGSFRILRQGLPVELPQHRFLLLAYREVLELSNTCSAFFGLDERGDVFAHLDGLVLRVETVEDVVVLHEIYVRGIYNISHPRPFVLMDVGMNVGFTSLYYARRGVARIIGYEPMRPTMSKAQDNFSTNAAVARAITPKPFGLGGQSASFEVTYSPAWKSSVGVGGLPEAYRRAKDVTREQLVIHDIVEELEQVIAESPGLDVMMKIDCEGSEYDIIDRMAEADRLRVVTFMMIEWHRRRISAGPDTLLKQLSDSGMTCLLHEPHGHDIGMIYAFRS